jgi:hypothetical protein
MPAARGAANTQPLSADAAGAFCCQLVRLAAAEIGSAAGLAIDILQCSASAGYAAWL